MGQSSDAFALLKGLVSQFAEGRGRHRDIAQDHHSNECIRWNGGLVRCLDGDHALQQIGLPDPSTGQEHRWTGQSSDALALLKGLVSQFAEGRGRHRDIAQDHHSNECIRWNGGLVRCLDGDHALQQIGLPDPSTGQKHRWTGP